MYSKLCVLWLYLYLLTTAAAHDNLALHKESEQSSTHFDYRKAETGNDGDLNNNFMYPDNSCIHTRVDANIQEAWWRVNLGFITRIREIIITYRKNMAQRLAGFTIFVSNTSDFKIGTRCYKQSGSLPDVERTSYPCTAIGRYVTVYNDRFHNRTYPSDYNTDGAILELCEVEVPGCNLSSYGQNCGRPCYCKELTCDYRTGNCDGDCQPGYTGNACNTRCPPGFYGDRCSFSCLHCGGNSTCNQSGVCLDGCEVGFYPDDSKICSKQCGQCNGTRCYLDGSCPKGCVDGYYSNDCKVRCPNNCYNRRCESQFGKCIACENGYFDEYCDVECPRHCLRKQCDIRSGYCLGCEPGLYGHDCSNECLHCGGNGTCNDLGFCLNGCETGYLSDYSPGCSVKLEKCEKDMRTTPTLPLVIGIAGVLFLALIGTMIYIIWNRRNRPQAETRSQTYMQSVVENPTEHVYSDIAQGMQNLNVSFDKDMVE